MHPRLIELLDHADGARHELLAVVTTLTPARYGARPSTGAWSVAEQLAHLYLVEHSSVRAMFRAFKNARQSGLGPETETGSLIGALDHTGLKDGLHKREAPTFVQPAEIVDLESALGRLEESRESLRAWAREADGFALATVRWPHPALGELNLYEWVVMIADHELRHLAQIRDALTHVDE